MMALGTASPRPFLNRTTIFIGEGVEIGEGPTSLGSADILSQTQKPGSDAGTPQ
jgi:hypothetical protein